MIKYREAFKISRDHEKKELYSPRLESNLVACAAVFIADRILIAADQFSHINVWGSIKRREKSLLHRRLIRSRSNSGLSFYRRCAGAAGEGTESSDRRWQPGLQRLDECTALTGGLGGWGMYGRHAQTMNILKVARQ